MRLFLLPPDLVVGVPGFPGGGKPDQGRTMCGQLRGGGDLRKWEKELGSYPQVWITEVQ